MHIRKLFDTRQLWTYKRGLFKKQDGRCCYCNKRMFMFRLSERDTRQNHPKQATFEHLVNNKDRKTLRDQLAIKLACYQCNVARNVLKDSDDQQVSSETIAYLAKNPLALSEIINLVDNVRAKFKYVNKDEFGNRVTATIKAGGTPRQRMKALLKVIA